MANMVKGFDMNMPNDKLKALRTNSLEYATILNKQLDNQIDQAAVTNWMLANSRLITYMGGKTVKVPTLTTDGLADYSRGNGNRGEYVDGKISLTNQTYDIRIDRGRKFRFDANDVDETNYAVTIASVLGRFQNEKVIPEMDAYRISELAQNAVPGNIKSDYTLDKDTIVPEINAGISKIRSAGYQNQLIIHATYETIGAISDAVWGKMDTINFKAGAIDTTVPAINGCPIIATPSNRMYNKIVLQDGTTAGQEDGGFKEADDAVQINFLIVATTTPVAFIKRNALKILNPIDNQLSDDWVTSLRIYHDLWVFNNRKNSIYLNLAPKPSAVKSK